MQLDLVLRASAGGHAACSELVAAAAAPVSWLRVLVMRLVAMLALISALSACGTPAAVPEHAPSASGPTPAASGGSTGSPRASSRPEDTTTTNPPGASAAAAGGLIVFAKDGGVGGSELHVIAPDGSVVRTVPNVAPHGAVAWSPDGTQAAFVDSAGLEIMSADGSDRRTLFEDVPGGYLDVAWAPDGSHIVFSRTSGIEADIFVSSLDGTDARQLTNGPGLKMQAAWSPDGTRIAFSRELDHDDRGSVLHSINNDGDFPGNGTESSLHVINVDGSNLRKITDVDAIVGGPAWSPDGLQIAFSRREFPASGSPSSYNPPWDIWIMAADGTDQRPLISSLEWSELSPTWSPSGELIAFAANTGGPFGIYVMNADGTEVRRIAGPASVLGWPSWVPVTKPH